jgi:hypothetical protein
MNRAADTVADFLPFARSGESLPPPRIRAVLEGCYQQFWSLLSSALTRGFDEHEAELFRQAERARNSNEQHRLLELMRELRKRQPEFLRACRDGIQRSLLRLVDRRIVADDWHAETPASPARIALSLADPDQLEEELLLRSLAARAEIRASGELQALAYRLALIAQDVPDEIDHLAIGPHAVFTTLLLASRRLDVPVADRIALLRRIDKLLYADAGSVYARINRWFVEHRVLPNLNLKPQFRVARNASAPGTTPKQAATEHTTPGPSSHEGGARTAGAPATPDLSATQSTAESGPPSSSAPATNLPLDDAAASGDATEYSFDLLRSLLAARRPAADSAGDPAGISAPRQAVVSALSEMQAAQARRPSGAAEARRPLADLKRELVSRLPPAQGGMPARLSEEDSDVVDLVGYLFDQLLTDYQPNNPGHGLLQRLQLPVLKVALNDKGFFTQRHHPARRLLNALAETTVYWLDGSPQDQAVIEKMDWVVDRANRDYQDDVAAFRELFDDLSRHLAELSRKAEVAERRHVEAAKGREKLELARSTAAQWVAERLARSADPPPLPVRRLLERPWTDVLALSILRYGTEHTVTRDQVDFVDRLIELFAPGRPLAEQRAESRELRRLLVEGLSTIGIHEDAIAEAWTEVHRITEDARPESSATAAKSVAHLIAAQPALGTSTATSAPAASAVQAAAHSGPGEPGTAMPPPSKGLLSLPMSPHEQAVAEELKKVPFGTWFEFTVNQQGDKVMRKLCWLSPVTGRCLFVNARGGRALERHVRDVAWEIERGTCRRLEPVRESLVDRAWKRIVGRLRGGEAAIPQAAGAQAP